MTTTGPTKAAVKELVTARTHCDKVVARKDGAFSLRRTYFYRMGMNPVKLAEEYAKAIPEMEVVSCSDYFNHWPKDSYFEVVMRLKPQVTA